MFLSELRHLEVWASMQIEKPELPNGYVSPNAEIVEVAGSTVCNSNSNSEVYTPEPFEP